MKIRHLILVAGVVTGCASVPVIVEQADNRNEQDRLALMMAKCSPGDAPTCFTVSDAETFPDLCKSVGGRLVCRTAQTTWFEETPEKRHLRINEMIVSPAENAYCDLMVDAYTTDSEGGVVQAFATSKNPVTRRAEISALERVIEGSTVLPGRGSTSGVFDSAAISWIEQEVLVTAYQSARSRPIDEFFFENDELFDLICGDKTR